jgi:hypothetical protein
MTVAIARPVPNIKTDIQSSLREQGTFSGHFGYRDTETDDYPVGNISGIYESRIWGERLDGTWILDNNGYYSKEQMSGVAIGHLLILRISGDTTVGLISFNNNGQIHGICKAPHGILPIFDIWGTYQPN